MLNRKPRSLGRRLRKRLRRFRLRCRRMIYRPSIHRWVILLFVGIMAIGLFFAIRYLNRPDPTLEESPQDYRILICRYATRSDLPEVFVHKVVLAESSGDPQAVSRLNAKGLMQIMPAAETDALKHLPGRERGDLFDSEYNLLIGTTYLRILADRFDGDAYLVLAAYHMGPTRVSKHLKNNPGISGKLLVDRFAGPATRAYCDKILQGKSLRLHVTRPLAYPNR